jgi:hypothetical protein
VYESPEGLVVEGSNSRIVFGQRQVSVEGLFEKFEEYEEGERSQYKTVYINLAFPIYGRDEGRDVIFQRSADTYVGNYGISYTVLEGVGYYITIFPPGGALYEHAVISEDRVALHTHRRRKVYLMDEGERKTLILV